jgi:hypothetical protein
MHTILVGSYVIETKGVGIPPVMARFGSGVAVRGEPDRARRPFETRMVYCLSCELGVFFAMDADCALF